jgi:hypothetical protein
MSGRRVLIIVSAARSGSKFLRDLLGASRECAVVPYDVNFVWRHGNEGRGDDALSPDLASEEQATYIRRTISRLAGLHSAGDGRLVVEKTVSNSLRVPYVARVFPEAQFVHLIRDGRAVAESARRVWHEPAGGGSLASKIRYFPFADFRYALWYLRNRLRLLGRSGPPVWGPRYPGIELDLETQSLLLVCARQWSQSVMSSQVGFARLPPESVHHLRYEDLLDDEGSLAEVCKFAGLLDSAAVLAARRERIEPVNRDKWRSMLSNAEFEELERLLGPQLRDLGYER